MTTKKKLYVHTHYWLWATIGLLLLTIWVLLLMGRVPMCTCGYILVWAGNVWSSDNSQHLFDWYSFSHVIHGFIFYWALWKLFPHWSWQKRLFFGVLIEAGWEVLENSPLIINRYREGTISLDYYGDSIINAFMDIMSMMVGFWAARKYPTWSIVAAAIVMELFVGYWIRDNLTLNVLMLVYPSAFIKAWQMGIGH